MEAPNTAGGLRKGAQLTGPFISDYELWRQRRPKFFIAFSIWKMVNFFFTKSMANNEF